MKEHKIQLGDKVRCIYSGYTGIVVARTEFINGCTQYAVIGKVGKNNKYPDEGDPSIDENSLEVIKPKKKPRVKRYTGGPSSRITRRNY